MLCPPAGCSPPPPGPTLPVPPAPEPPGLDSPLLPSPGREPGGLLPVLVEPLGPSVGLASPGCWAGVGLCVGAALGPSAGAGGGWLEAGGSGGSTGAGGPLGADTGASGVAGGCTGTSVGVGVTGGVSASLWPVNISEKGYFKYIFAPDICIFQKLWVTPIP